MTIKFIVLIATLLVLCQNSEVEAERFEKNGDELGASGMYLEAMEKYKEAKRILSSRISELEKENEDLRRTVSSVPCRRFEDPHEDKYWSKDTTGTVVFDYSNNNGRFSIGKDIYLFEVDFSKGSDKSIHIYNDPSSISTVSIAAGAVMIEDIEDARVYDTSSRSRTLSFSADRKTIAVLQNMNGFYAAVKVNYIKDDTRGAENDEVSFDYVILNEGGYNFSDSDTDDDTDED